MTVTDTDLTAEMAESFDRLWPLLRSLTGEGARASHAILSEIAPFERLEIASGTPVFDWTVPPEWRVGAAHLTGPDGRRVVDLADHPLHLLNYAIGVDRHIDRNTLEDHLYSKPELPDAIPYVTSYYAPRWGFCLSEQARRALPEGDYRAVIEAEHIEGSMTLSELVLPGREPDEVLFSSYTCHPGLANDELCGPIVLAYLARRLAAWPQRRLTYRFALHPETIGALAYLHLRGRRLKERLVAGYVVTNVGVPRPFRYKRSRKGGTAADRAAESLLRDRHRDDAVIGDFEPLGSDERQFGSPGFDLPVGVIARSPNNYPEYHSSLDNRDFISFDAMAETLELCEAVCRALEGTETAHPARHPDTAPKGPRYRNLSPYGEPQLGRRGLYPTLGRTDSPDAAIKALMWTLNLSDGDHGLDDIARRSGLPTDALHEAAETCVEAGLMERLG